MNAIEKYMEEMRRNLKNRPARVKAKFVGLFGLKFGEDFKLEERMALLEKAAETECPVWCKRDDQVQNILIKNLQAMGVRK